MVVEPQQKLTEYCPESNASFYCKIMTGDGCGAQYILCLLIFINLS